MKEPTYGNLLCRPTDKKSIKYCLACFLLVVGSSFVHFSMAVSLSLDK